MSGFPIKLTRPKLRPDKDLWSVSLLRAEEIREGFVVERFSSSDLMLCLIIHIQVHKRQVNTLDLVVIHQSGFCACEIYFFNNSVSNGNVKGGHWF